VTRLLALGMTLALGAARGPGVTSEARHSRDGWSLTITAGGQTEGSQQYWVWLRNDSAVRRRISLRALAQQREVGQLLVGAGVWTLVSPHGPDATVSQRLIDPSESIGLVAVMGAPAAGEAKPTFALSFQELDPATGDEHGRAQVLMGGVESGSPSRLGDEAKQDGWDAVLRPTEGVAWLTIRNTASAPRMICVRSILAKAESGSVRALWSATGDCANSPDSEVVRECESTTRLIPAANLRPLETVVVVAEVPEGPFPGPHRVVSLRAR
jgi:hypothetical protein